MGKGGRVDRNMPAARRPTRVIAVSISAGLFLFFFLFTTTTSRMVVRAARSRTMIHSARAGWLLCGPLDSCALLVSLPAVFLSLKSALLLVKGRDGRPRRRVNAVSREPFVLISADSAIHKYGFASRARRDARAAVSKQTTRAPSSGRSRSAGVPSETREARAKGLPTNFSLRRPLFFPPLRLRRRVLSGQDMPKDAFQRTDFSRKQERLPVDLHAE